MGKIESIDFEKRVDKKAIDYSGCSLKGHNETHYEEVLRQAARLNNGCEGSAIVLGCGAGYGAFYLRQFGFQGSIQAEDIDPNSIKVAKFLQSFMGYPKVAETFRQRGLKAARDIALEITGTNRKANSIDEISFEVRDSNLPRDVELKHSVVILDFLHSHSYLGNQKSTDNLSIRLALLTQKGTILSYRGGTEIHRLEKLGYKEVRPMIYVCK